MKNIIFIAFGTLVLSCTTIVSNTNEKVFNVNDPTCPKGHTDSIIPILYGMPTEEAFAEADSGLIWLGGCEIPEVENNWHCKKHIIQF